MNENNLSRFQTRLPLLLALTLAVGMFIGQKLPHYDQLLGFQTGNYQKRSNGTLDEVLRYIQAKYVDSVDIEKIKNQAIDKVLEQLDPHSVYITSDELKVVEDDMNGNFEGIGIEFLVLDDTIQVVSAISGGPSEAVGIQPGDKIVSIGDSTVAGVKISSADIFKKLRGSKGSTVKVGIRRGHETKLRYFTITRDIIPVNSVEIAYMLDDKTGYIKVNRFSARTHQEFMSALKPLVESKGLQNLVIDLRGNPGGYLNEAVDMLSQFFPEGKLLVYTEGRKEERFEYKSSGRARFPINKVALLIDEGSASASEIMAGAIQDHDRGWIVGRRSFGKGLVQEQYDLSDGGALRLTVARYFTPSGRCIQRDYTDGNAYAHDTDARLHNGELSDEHKIKIADSTQYFTGMGRVVFGGGGIIPDVFVPLDTTYANPYFYKMRQQLPYWASHWMDGRDKASLPQNLPDFMANFDVSDDMFAQFVSWAEKEGNIEHNAEQSDVCKAELKHQLKARIAKLLFKDEGMYKVLNNDDPAIEKALQLVRSNQPLVRK